MAAGGSTVIYGGLTFFNVLTRYFNQEFVRDDSGTDIICQKFTLAITTHINALTVARTGMLPSSGSNDPAADLQAVRYLLADRQHFEYWMGCGFDQFGNRSGGLLQVICDPANTPGSTNINLKDVANGPRVNVQNVTRVSADNLLRVDLEFEVQMLICAANGTTGNVSGILNNRWTVVDDIDQNFFTTRTFTGKLRLSSSQINGNDFRYLCVPPLQPGMRRDHMQFAVSEDALNLLYTVVDKEVAFAPPAPATTWSARFTERSSYEGMPGFFSDAEITLGGDRFVDKQKLFAIAASMALSKFQNGIRVLNNNDPKYYVQEIQLIDEYSDSGSFIHLRATARRTDSNEKAVLGLPSRNLGVPIGPLNEIADVVANYDPRFSRDSRPGENIEVRGPVPLVGAFAAFLQSPCNQPAAIFQGLQGADGQAPQGQGTLPTVVAVINNGIPDDQTITAIYSTDNNNGMYDTWISETHDETNANRVQLPIANTGSQGSSIGDAWWSGQATDPSGDTAVIADLAPPTTRRTQIAHGKRVGIPPVIPTPKDYTDTDGTVWKIDFYTKSFSAPTLCPDGKYLFSVEVRQAWIAKAAKIAGKAITALNPWAANKQPVIPAPQTIDPR